MAPGCGNVTGTPQATVIADLPLQYSPKGKNSQG
jgi:hypothetical protein